VQQNDTRSRSTVAFSATLKTSEGDVKVDNVSLNGRQSKILVTDYRFGKRTLLYATADVLIYGIFDTEVLVFYLKEGQEGEFAFKNEPNLIWETNEPTQFSASSSGNRQAFRWKQPKGTTAVKFSNGVLVYLMDQTTAWKFWAPATTDNPHVKPNQQIFVIGPYLVRSARAQGDVLQIFGDNDNSTTIEAYVGNPAIKTLQWNGNPLQTTSTSYGSLKANIPGTESRVVSLPALTNWVAKDSLPEIDPAFDDSKWKVCDKSTSQNPYPPLTRPVLYSSDYGFYTGAKLYRGYFDGDSSTSVNITCSGGLAFGWNAWLNGQLIGGDTGAKLETTTSANLRLPKTALKTKDNVLTVVVDYHGHDQASTAQGVNNPRGILGARLLPSGTATSTGFKMWKLQGNAGGSANIDSVRGPMNEGGLYGERLGWHLPKFDSSGWNKSRPQDGLSKSGIMFYITTFELNLDRDLDVPLGIELSAVKTIPARVMFWVNGYQYGKFLPHIGPQTRFPLPPGVINNRGNNTLALSIWAQSDGGSKLSEVKLISYGKYHTSFDFNQDWSYLQPGWIDRQKYS
jgi:beta-galactosidase GanA